MPKIKIVDGNKEITLSTIEENIRAYMVKGEPGSDGISPTATVSKVDDTATITVTDKNGTTSADVIDGFDPTITTSKTNKTTTLTITDINGTRTAEILDGIDLTGGVPTNGVIGFDTDEIIYTCDGTETGDCYLTYDGVDFSFTMPIVEEGDVLVFNTSTLTLTLDNTTINIQPLPGTGTELTFDYDIPGGYEEVDENDGLLKTKCITNVYDNTSTYSVGDFCIYDDVLYKCTTAVTTAEDFDSTKWSSTNVTTEVSSVASITDSYSTSTTDGYSANYLNRLIQTQYANGQNVSINDLNTTGKWRIYIPANSNDANYLGWYGNTLVETFVQSSNNGCMQRLTQMSGIGRVCLIRYCDTDSFSYSDTLYSEGQGVVLYNNSTGSSGDVTLNDSAANYSYLEIFYRSSDNAYGSVKVYSPDGKTVILSANWTNATYLYFKTRAVAISGTSLATNSIREGEARIGNGVATTFANGSYIYITRVLGYK